MTPTRGNTFYQEFDVETWDGSRRPYYRTHFQQDRDRLIHTSAVRRLQGKTQVFLSGEYDFYRTRLTHSLEVAQIGRSICQWLKTGTTARPLSEDFHIDTDLVEAICLAHDLGHPPFGHAGERQLHALMKNHGGFEGNAQTLRLLVATIYSNSTDRSGMQPTRALMDGVMKYKTLLKDHPNPIMHYIYDDQAECVQFVFGQRKPPRLLRPGDDLNAFRSIECQIMDWADNTAYCWSDLADGIHAGFIDIGKIERWARDQQIVNNRTLRKLINIIRTDVVTRDFSMEIGRFVEACHLSEVKNFMSGMTNRYRFKLDIAPEIEKEYQLLKKLSADLVFRSPQVQQIEFKGTYMLQKMFEVFMDNHNLLPKSVQLIVKAESNEQRRTRLICDHIAGMTDGFAQRTYRRLFDPTYGSLIDLV